MDKVEFSTVWCDELPADVNTNTRVGSIAGWRAEFSTDFKHAYRAAMTVRYFFQRYAVVLDGVHWKVFSTAVKLTFTMDTSLPLALCRAICKYDAIRRQYGHEWWDDGLVALEGDEHFQPA